MSNLELEINNSFKKLVSNYQTLIDFIKWELVKGYDNEFWEGKLQEAIRKQDAAKNQIKHIPSQEN